jgi:hypothetical protein
MLSACAADVGSRARSTAARDLSCAESQTRIVDEAVGLYRIQACGVEATYQCAEDHRSLSMRCEQIAAYKIEDPPARKAGRSSLAKSAN